MAPGDGLAAGWRPGGSGGFIPNRAVESLVWYLES